MLSYILQDRNGLVLPTHSIAAGLDYPGVGPEHAYLKDSGRAEYVTVQDSDAVRAFQTLAQLEGIIPALEPSHAIAYVIENAPRMNRDDIIVVTLSGRGDKDVEIVRRSLAERFEPD
jgi:tryptophan synthase beta chain